MPMTKGGGEGEKEVVARMVGSLLELDLHAAAAARPYCAVAERREQEEDEKNKNQKYFGVSEHSSIVHPWLLLSFNKLHRLTSSCQ